MFTFGTNDIGASLVPCNCETAATTDGLCDQVVHSGYRLYKYYASSGNYVLEVIRMDNILILLP